MIDTHSCGGTLRQFSHHEDLVRWVRCTLVGTSFVNKDRSFGPKKVSFNETLCWWETR